MNEAQTKDIIPVHQIVALDEENGIGIGGNLPWKLTKDWNHFLRMTTKVKVFSLKQSNIFIILCDTMSSEIYLLYLPIFTE